jgi:hypothetical protein
MTHDSFISCPPDGAVLCEQAEAKYEASQQPDGKPMKKRSYSLQDHVT